MNDFLTRAKSTAAEMRHVFDPTPLQKNAHLSAKYGADIFLKREDLSPVRSYKIRGALNAMRKHLEKNPDRSLFVAASAGNHAQGVAFACAHFGKQGRIFMPVTTPQQKIDRTRVFGGKSVEIELVGDYFDDTLEAAQTYCSDQSAHFLSPFDDRDVIEGQSTVALEIIDQFSQVPDVIILPVGGGGLSAGVISYLCAAGAESHVVLVEPKGGANLSAALAASKPVKLEKLDTFVDGAAVAKIGESTFEVLKSVQPANVIRIDEDRLCTTMLEMLTQDGMVLEPAGALAIDALKDVAPWLKGKKVVCLVSGGNFDFERLPEVKERAQRSSGLKKYFILRMPQRPGALKDFLSMLGPNDDIARFEYLKKSARNFGSVLIGIESKDARNFAELELKMSQAGFSFRDITRDTALADFLV